LIPTFASLGLISYSLYLTHSFVMMHWYWFGFTKLHIPSIALAIMTPLSVAFGYVFFRFCERPFMTSVAARRTPKPTDVAVMNEEIAVVREAA
jgi:peptidoglycan/LPS O-acetylase OafA/YrhL